MRDRFRGCLLGGAVGDALGAPVEFWKLDEIRRRLGPKGATGYAGGEAQVTDDTQMTLFTAEGLIRASVRQRGKGICHPPGVLHGAYLRWLHTQGVPWDEIAEGKPDGWLVKEPLLHHPSAPGRTCLSALRSGRAGSTDHPLNDSKGCGGVMRVAPVGLFLKNPDKAFSLGCEAAALTHGHPSGWIAAGALSAMIAWILGGSDLAGAVAKARRLAVSRPGHEETVRALDAAVALASGGLPAPEKLETLGAGWVAEEALAIAVCCALAAPDARAALLAAVNHSGDSDSTGAICGNLLGAAQGLGAIPEEWIAPLDLGPIVRRVADDLWRERFEPPEEDRGEAPDDWWTRYPGA